MYIYNLWISCAFLWTLTTTTVKRRSTPLRRSPTTTCTASPKTDQMKRLFIYVISNWYKQSRRFCRCRQNGPHSYCTYSSRKCLCVFVCVYLCLQEQAIKYCISVERLDQTGDLPVELCKVCCVRAAKAFCKHKSYAKHRVCLSFVKRSMETFQYVRRARVLETVHLKICTVHDSWMEYIIYNIKCVVELVQWSKDEQGIHR